MSERFNVTSRKFVFLIFEEILIVNPNDLKVIRTFFCMIELQGPSLLNMYINPLSWYKTILAGLIILQIYIYSHSQTDCFVQCG